MRAPLGDHDAADECAATRARLILLTVDIVELLKRAAFSGAIHIVRNGRSAVTNRKPEHFEQTFVQAFGALFRDAAGGSAWMNASVEQQFVRINVADAAEERLIEEKSLDAAAMLAQAVVEFCKGDVQSIGSDAIEGSGKFREELEAAELADVIVNQRPVVQVKDSARVFSGRGVPEQPAGHAEVDEQDAKIEVDENLLSTAPDGCY